MNIKSIGNACLAFLQDEEGASAVEYGLIVGLIAVAIILTITNLGTGLDGLFGTVTDEVTNAGSGSGGGSP